MLPKKNRVSRLGFKQGSGRTVRSDFGSLRVATGAGTTQVAVVVPKSRIKTAVVRNRLRRIIYDDVAALLSLGSQKKIFVYPSSAVLKLKPKDRRREINQLLRLAGVLK